jgi:ribosomal-protein-alanine N-acetyltransferase
MIANSFFSSERMEMRHPVPEDAELIFQRYSSLLEVTCFLGWPRHQSLADSNAFIRFSDNEWENNHLGPLLCFDRQSGEFIGSTGLAMEDQRVASTGCVIATGYLGQGFGTECLQSMQSLANSMRLLRLLAFVHPENPASTSMLEKCGFKRDDSRAKKMVFPNLPGAPVVKADCYGWESGQY